MEALAQCELIRQFMVAVAPQVTSHSLEIGADMGENAALVLEASMQLAARYNELYETLTTTAPQDSTQTQDPDQAGQRQAQDPASGIRKAQARIPASPPDVSGLRRTPIAHRSSPEPTPREPPSPYR